MVLSLSPLGTPVSRPDEVRAALERLCALWRVPDAARRLLLALSAFGVAFGPLLDARATGYQLAEHLELHPRTIRRDRAALAQLALPWLELESHARGYHARVRLDGAAITSDAPTPEAAHLNKDSGHLADISRTNPGHGEDISRTDGGHDADMARTPSRVGATQDTLPYSQSVTGLASAGLAGEHAEAPQGDPSADEVFEREELAAEIVEALDGEPTLDGAERTAAELLEHVEGVEEARAFVADTVASLRARRYTPALNCGLFLHVLASAEDVALWKARRARAASQPPTPSSPTHRRPSPAPGRHGTDANPTPRVVYNEAQLAMMRAMGRPVDGQEGCR